MISSVPIAVLVFVISAGASYLHLVHTADRVSSIFGGYVFSLGVFPFLFGGAIGLCGIGMLHKSMAPRLKKFWWLPALGSVAALIPIVFVLFVMSQPEY
jgi:hypothetical protein